MAGYGIFIPIIAYNVHTGTSNLANQSLLLSMFAIGQFISSPILGSFSDYYGIKKTILMAIIGYFGTIFLTLVVKNFHLILGLRLISGIFAGGGVASVENYIAKMVTEKEKAYYYTFTSMSIGVGMIIGPILGFIYLKFNLMIAILMLILGCTIFIINKVLIVKDEVLEKKTSSYSKNFISDLKTISKNSKNIHILLTVFLFGFVASSFESIGLLYVYTYIKVDALNIIVSLILVIVLIYYVMILSPKIINKYNKYHLTFVQITAIILGLALTLVAKYPVLILFGLFAIICGMSSLISTLTTYTAELNKSAGIILGLRNSCLSIGSILGPILIGRMYDISAHLSIVGIILLCIVIIIVSVIYERMINERIKIN